jgi:YD repeat-containing protein
VPKGRLIEIEDGDGDVTTIERDDQGNPLAIVGPFGQRTTFTLDANGYLASMTNPANETVSFNYTPDGLLTGMTMPGGATGHLFEVSRTDQQQREPAFVDVPHRLPQHASRLQGHVRHAPCLEVVGQRSQVPWPSSRRSGPL